MEWPAFLLRVKNLLKLNISTNKQNSPKQRVENKGDVYGTGNQNQNSFNNTTIINHLSNSTEPIKLANLVAPNRGELKNKKFEDKELWGPAIILPMRSTFELCNWDDTPEATLITLDSDVVRSGIIMVLDCEFRNCIFRGVSIAAPEDLMATIKEGFGV